MTAGAIILAILAVSVAAGGANAAVIDVHLRGQSFEPNAISAQRGDTIVFYNEDNELHSLLLPDNAALLAEHFIDPHGRYEVIIPATAKPAIHSLVCTIHMDMKGTLQIIEK